jgi:hypothetical protein
MIAGAQWRPTRAAPALILELDLDHARLQSMHVHRLLALGAVGLVRPQDHVLRVAVMGDPQAAAGAAHQHAAVDPLEHLVAAAIELQGEATRHAFGRAQVQFAAQGGCVLAAQARLHECKGLVVVHRSLLAAMVAPHRPTAGRRRPARGVGAGPRREWEARQGGWRSDSRIYPAPRGRQRKGRHAWRPMGGHAARRISVSFSCCALSARGRGGTGSRWPAG